jgi:hypothetical protein
MVALIFITSFSKAQWYTSPVSQGQLNVTLTPSNVNCEGLNTGQITANVTGGVPPYVYFWTNGEQGQFITNLNSGFYGVKVFDQNSLGGYAEITLTEPEQFRIVQFDATIYPNNYNTSCYYCNDGAITVAVAGGTPPYTYAWSDGSNLQNRTNLLAKDYQLVVTDAFGCQVRELNKELSKPEREDWTSNGNANVNANSFIGTIYNIPLVLKAGNLEGFRLMPNGKIGIGTTNPAEKFEVAGGNAKFGGDVNVIGNLKLPTIASSTPRFLKLLSNGGVSTYSELELQSLIYKTNTNCGNLNPDGSYDSPPNWGSLQFLSGYKKSLTTCGKVGINFTQPGTEPLEALHVEGNSLINGDVKVNANAYVIGNVDATGYRLNGVLKEFSQWTTTASGIHFNTGKVHIGTSISNTNHADALLTVDGKMVVKSCYVNTTSWADDVFSKNYKLTTLAEVEKFYKLNQHLPEIPTEKEVIENGVNTADMIKLLLKKVEELTLYSVQQQKEIEALKNCMK